MSVYMRPTGFQVCFITILMCKILFGLVAKDLWSGICLPAWPHAPQAFQSYITTILTRKNTITGVVYKDDPTIMAVELANEPHTRSGAIMRSW